ncbi:MAG: hypothetical protein ACREF3_20620 [Acetobacteraceae bacterium]
MRVLSLTVLAALALLSACGPTPEEQRAMDQQRCGGFGFAAGTDAFAHCMMGVSQQREAQDAADQRAAADRDAANKRTQDAIQAAKDKADRDAWDQRTGQGAYAHGSTTTPIEPAKGFGIPDIGSATQGMNCTTTSNASGSTNNRTTTSSTICHN